LKMAEATDDGVTGKGREAMNLKDILYPTDFSRESDHALRLASTLAAESGATLHIVHVDELRDLTAAMGEAGYLMASAVEDRQEVLGQLERVLPTVATEAYEHHYLRGSPVIEILAFAESEHIDLIVMASHGRTGLSRLLMGSIAEGVMRRAQCPVLVVKQPSAERDDTESRAEKSESQTRYASGARQ
jgi:nucleotide-binding universal stress UspA family protein